MILLGQNGADEFELAANCVTLPTDGFPHIDGKLEHTTYSRVFDNFKLKIRLQQISLQAHFLRRIKRGHDGQVLHCNITIKK